MVSVGVLRHTDLFMKGATFHASGQIFRCPPASQRAAVGRGGRGKGGVVVNGRGQRASYDVKPGDRIAIRFGQRTLEVEVLTVADNVGKAEAAAMYREIMDSPS